jgi:hypothetical protein
MTDIIFLFTLLLLTWFTIRTYASLQKEKEKNLLLINTISSHNSIKSDYQNRTLVLECKHGDIHIDEEEQSFFSIVGK